MKFKTRVENLEVRGKEIKEGKTGNYAIVKFDDEAGERLEFIFLSYLRIFWWDIKLDGKYPLTKGINVRKK